MAELVAAAPLQPKAQAEPEEAAALPMAPGAAPGKLLSAAALRALEEAAARRAITAQHSADEASGGPKGLEPTRFGDWERKGLAVDF